MFDEFLKRPVGDLLLILFGVVLALAAIGAIVVIVIRLSGLTEAGKDGFHFGKKKKYPVKKSPHSECIHGKDIVLLLQKQAEMFDQKCKIERRILPDQKTLVKTEALKLRGKAQSLFLRILRQTLSTDEKEGLVEHQDYREYVRALKDSIELAREIIETSFEENHYATRSEKDFQQLATGKTIEVCQTITDYLNEAYSGTVVTRERIYDENQHIMDEIKNSIEHMFWSARDISLLAFTEVKKLETDFELLVEKTI